jgi:flagellar biosynthesis/type III secretory pathway protein FliH
MKANEQTEIAMPLSTVFSRSEDLNSVPTEFMGLYQASYQAGYASGREAGFRQGYQAGYGEGRGQGTNSAPAAAEKHAAGIPKTRLFGLPCSHCRRLFFSDEARCPYCKTAVSRVS